MPNRNKINSSNLSWGYRPKKVKKHRLLKLVIWIILIALLISGLSRFGYNAKASTKVQNDPIKHDLKPSPSLTPHNIPSVVKPVKTQYELIHDEIEEVFGKYAPRAFQLLQSPICHENLTLDPKARHKNDDEWNSVDWGVFQLNDHWQRVWNVSYLTDYHINIRMAWNKFVNDGYNFHNWACGKQLGI